MGRLLLSSTNMSRVLKPVISRCLCIRIPAPTIDEITSILLKICTKENLKFTAKSASHIGKTSGRNLRTSLLMLEDCLSQNTKKYTTNVPRLDWVGFVEDIASDLFRQQNVEMLRRIKVKIKKLPCWGIPPDFFFRKILQYMSPKLNEQCKHQVVKAVTYFEHRVNR